jgi:hypothetical protein
LLMVEHWPVARLAPLWNAAAKNGDCCEPERLARMKLKWHFQLSEIDKSDSLVKSVTRSLFGR